MTEKYLLFNLDDEESKKLGEVISNSTCKRIVNLLAEKELGASEIAKELGMALNTVTYNLSKLVGAGLIEEAKSFWSVKGKKMPSYRLVNKAIVISPKKGNIYSKIKGVLPVVVTGAVFTGFIFWERINSVFNAKNQITPSFDMIRTAESVASSGIATAENVGLASSSGLTASSGVPTASWVLMGIWVLLLFFVIWSIARKKD